MLNFDPYRWNAEHGSAEPPRFVATVATVARVRARNEKSESGELAATVATPATPATLPVREPPAVLLRDWHRHLAALDDLEPPSGYALNWWAQAVRDAWWLYENFASRAVRDGWSAHDLFGVLPWHTGWGGLCDRLRGARNLKMETAGQKAVWSSWGVTDWTCIGAGDSLIESGLVLIWELSR